MERLEECQKHSRTPIQSSRFLSYRFHRPLEISSVKRNAQDSRGVGGEGTGGGTGRTSDGTGNYGGNSRDGRRGENKTPVSINDFEIVCVPARLEEPETGIAGHKGGGSVGSGGEVG